MKSNRVEAISAAKRKSLSPEQFALPAQKKYPIDTAGRTRDAASRLEAQKKAGTISDADYKRARAAIARAAKRFGINSIYNQKKASSRRLPPLSKTTPGGFRARYQHPSGHVLEIRHSSDDDKPVRGETFEIDASGYVEAVTKLKAAEERLASLPESIDREALEADVKKLRDELAEPRWNQITKLGAFRGHPAGPFEITPAVNDEILRNYRDVDKGQCPIDFEHASEADETSGSIPQDGAPAAGWVLDLQNRGPEGLWGLCKFLDPALGYVREGRYRFFSPAIRFGAKHPETGQNIGARLTSVALVNRPFLRGMQPVAARDTPQGTVTMSTSHHEMMSRLKACMRMSDLATPDEMKAQCARLREHAEACGVHDKPVASSQGVHHMGVHLGDYFAPMADAMNVPAHMSISDLLDAVEEMIEAAIREHEERYHGMSDSTNTTTTTTVDMSDPSALTLKLGETQANLRASESTVRALTAEKTELTTKVSALQLQLRDAEANLAQANATIGARESEIKTLRDAEANRAEQEILSDVAEAFATYKDAKKLSDNDRESMDVVRRTKPELFARLYPRVNPSQRPLMQNLTGQRTPGPATAAHQMGDRDRPLPQTHPGPEPRTPGQRPLSAKQMDQLFTTLHRQHGFPSDKAADVAYRIACGDRSAKAELPAGLDLLRMFGSN